MVKKRSHPSIGKGMNDKYIRNVTMIKILSSLLICGFLTACSGTPSGQFNSMPNVIIMGEDSDRDSIPRTNRIFKRVMNSLSNQLNDEGFTVLDETTVTLDDFSQTGGRRSDAEILDIARSIHRPPLDIVVIYSMYASADYKGYTTKIRTRITGRMINVRTGRTLDHFEVESPRSWNAPADCQRECIYEVVGKYSRTIANDLGAVLSKKLRHMVRKSAPYKSGDRKSGGFGQAYSLIFDNFTPSEMQQIEEYLVIFSGYNAHRPTYSSLRRAEYWYESSIKSAKLNRNLNKMLAEINLRAMVTFSDNTYTVKKITFRGQKPVLNDDW
jgi:hypothetical protein